MKKEPLIIEQRPEGYSGEHAPVTPQLLRIDELRVRFGITDSAAIAKALRIPEKLVQEILKGTA